ncbi:MAG: DUF309 domain-containing protein [Anaerolineae bacterium]
MPQYPPAAKLPPGFEIRRLSRTEEYHEAEEIQCAAWGIIDRVDVTPSHVMVTAQKNGGVVMGAFAPTGEMAGFVWGFLGTGGDGKLKHVSHQLGVLPQYRGLHLGILLKRAQRGEIRRQGLDLMTWTYDPLETVNATLNLTWLGAVCNTFMRNVYGEIRDELNKGLPSDRFQVDWWVRSRWVHERLALAHPWDFAETVRALPIVNPAQPRPSSPSAPGSLDVSVTAPEILIQVPYNFQSVKSADLGLALAWRLHTREAFEHYFAHDYSAVAMLRGETADGKAAFYRLRRSARNRTDEFDAVTDADPWLVPEHSQPTGAATLREALAEFTRQYNAGYYWQAHETLEPAWSAAEGQEKLFLQALIRTAAAFQKLLAHDNSRGAARHLAWVVETLSPLDGAYHGVNVAALVPALRRAAEAAASLADQSAFDAALIPRIEPAE